jgi:predicted nucleic acid-binding protein
MKYALLVARANENGFNPSVADAQIAAVAKDRGFAIATQNADDFKQFDVPVINPWTGA